MWNTPYSFGPDGLLNPWLIYTPEVLSASSHVSTFLGDPLVPLEAQSIDALVHVDSVSWSRLIDGRIALLLATFPYCNHSARLKFERKASKDCGKENQVAGLTPR